MTKHFKLQEMRPRKNPDDPNYQVGTREDWELGLVFGIIAVGLFLIIICKLL